jgi:uncharacterized protein YecE (DUF72 family)
VVDGVIRVGVAGWDYPDWKGIVYPSGAARLDRLAHVARFVDVVEINSTFYRPARPEIAASWARRTAMRKGFRFTAKAHRSWSHDPASDLAEVVPETLAGLRPLRDANALGALLVQFPQRFHRGPEAIGRLARIAELARGWPLVVEVRHDSWMESSVEGWFRERDLGWCVVDQPRVGRAAAPRPRRTSRLAYLRLHGRNAADWFREGAGRDARYDYLYSEDEVRDLAVLARALAEGAEEMFVVQNNHFRGQALVNALQMKHRIEATRPAAPAELVRSYPALAASVVEDQSRLF